MMHLEKSAVVLLAVLCSFVALAEDASDQSLAPEAMAKRMCDAVSLPAFRLHAQVYSYAEGAAEPALSEEVKLTAAGARSRVEREHVVLGSDGAWRPAKTTVSVFDGNAYAKLTTFPEGKTPLAWKGPVDGNSREIGGLLLAGLDLEQLHGMEQEPGRCFVARNEKTGLIEVQVKGPTPMTVCVDPGHGFLVKRVEIRDEHGDTVRTCDVTFAERNGRWFPAEQRVESVLEGMLKPDSVVRIDAPELNTAIEDSLFQLAIPSDARVMPETVSGAEIAQLRVTSGLEKPVETAATHETSSQAQKSVSTDPGANPAPKRRRNPWPLWTVVAAIAAGMGLGLLRKKGKR